jgi:hypothetical protein
MFDFFKKLLLLKTENKDSKSDNIDRDKLKNSESSENLTKDLEK